MFTIKVIDRETEEKVIYMRNFRKNEEKAVKYFGLLKQDAMMQKDDYYDSDDEYKYSDLKFTLNKDDELISYFTVGNK